jgi:hypothetical protein
VSTNTTFFLDAFSLGKGEVESSIPSGSTRNYNGLPLILDHLPLRGVAETCTKLSRIADTNRVTEIRDATRLCLASQRRFSHSRAPASPKRALAAVAIVSWRGFFERSMNCVYFQR